MAGGVVYREFDPAMSVFFPKCPIYATTGLQCPSCGIQRAMHLMLHGSFVEAFRYNWYLLLVFPYVALIVVAELFSVEKLRRVLYSNPVLIAYLVSYFLWFALRNILHI